MSTRLLRALALATAGLLVVVIGSAADATSPPSKPTGLKAAPTSSSAVLTWSKTTNTTYWTVCLLTSATATTCYKASPRLSSPTITFTGLKPTGGRDYFFRVFAHGPGGYSRSADVGFDLTPAAAPSKPTNLRAAPTSSSAVLSWDRTTNTTYWTVCLLTSATATTCYKASPRLSSPTVTFTGLEPTDGRDYYFRVFAHGPGGYSRSGDVGFDLEPAGSRPPAPTGVTVKLSPSSATFSWPAVPTATSYVVCLWTDGSTGACHLQSEKVTGTSVTVSGLKPNGGGDYAYVLRASNAYGTSESARGRIDLPVTSTPSFALGSSTSTSMTATWGAATNADTYRVQVATSSSMTTGLKTFTTHDRSLTVTGLVPRTRYYVRVRGENSLALGSYTTALHRRLESEPFTVRVITYNLCGQDKCRTSTNGIKPWSTRKPLAGAIARGTRADVISTQESGDKDTNFITQLSGFKRAAYRSAKSLFYRTSRFDLIRAGTMTLDSARKRYAVWAELRDKTTRTPVFVVDPHLQPGKGKTNDDIRRAETRTLLSLTASANIHDVPVVFAGDFNSNADNAEYAGGYDAVLQVMTDADKLDAYSVAKLGGFGINITWNSANQGKNPPIKNEDHVDHIYVDPAIIVKTWRVVVTIDDRQYYVTPFATDHNPVQADLTVPGRAEEP